MKQKQTVIPRNFVAKHMQQICDAQVFVDRKKQNKRGYSKHKKAQSSDWAFHFKMIYFSSFKSKNIIFTIA